MGKRSVGEKDGYFVAFWKGTCRSALTAVRNDTVGRKVTVSLVFPHKSTGWTQPLRAMAGSWYLLSPPRCVCCTVLGITSGACAVEIGWNKTHREMAMERDWGFQMDGRRWERRKASPPNCIPLLCVSAYSGKADFYCESALCISLAGLHRKTVSCVTLRTVYVLSLVKMAETEAMTTSG